MPETLAAALDTPGLWWIAAAALIAGMVRGFSGFGTAMIYLPVAAQFVPPVWAIVTLTIMDVFGPLPNVPRAWRAAHRRDLLRLAIGAAAILPLGLMLLAVIRPETYRFAVSGLSLFLLLCLIFGLRWRGNLRPPLVYGIGGLSGFSGGLAGLPGPPVILTYMASPHPPEVIQANTLLHLFVFEFLILGMIALRGELGWTPVLIGVMMIVPNMAGNVLGARIFHPGREKVYRNVAYAVIAVSAVMGLPVWD